MFSKLIIDSRETELIKSFQNWNVGQERPEYLFKNLDVGDVHFYNPGNEDPVIIIERKTAKDLDASIIDKRLREQKHRLQSLSKDIIVIYLIEGFYECKQKALRLPKDTHLSSIVNTLVRDKIIVYHTPNLDESFNFILKVAKQSFKFKNCICSVPSKIEPVEIKPKPSGESESEESESESESADYLECIKSKKSDNIKDNLFDIMMIQIPGIGPKTSKAITKEYKSFYTLCMAYSDQESPEKMLSDLEMENGRKIGSRASRKVYDSLFNKK